MSGMRIVTFAIAAVGSATAQNYCTATDGSGNTLDFGPVRDGGTFTGVDSSGNQIAFVRLVDLSVGRPPQHPTPRSLTAPPLLLRAPRDLNPEHVHDEHWCRLLRRGLPVCVFAVLGACCAPPFPLYAHIELTSSLPHSLPHVLHICCCSARDVVRQLRVRDCLSVDPGHHAAAVG